MNRKIKRDIARLQEETELCTVETVTDDCNIHVLIHGLEELPLARMVIGVPTGYPFLSPIMTLTRHTYCTLGVHPAIGTDCCVCLFTKNDWSPSVTLVQLVRNVRLMMRTGNHLEPPIPNTLPQSIVTRDRKLCVMVADMIKIPDLGDIITDYVGVQR
jgi:ubiquitin-protein ligase